MTADRILLVQATRHTQVFIEAHAELDAIGLSIRVDDEPMVHINLDSRAARELVHALRIAAGEVLQ